MKFSDMMGKGAKTADDAETALPPAQVKAPPVPEAPIRFTPAPGPAEPVAEAPVAVTPTVPAAVEPAPESALVEPGATQAQPAILDVMHELAPRRAEASDQELEASAWLDGLTQIDDDLLPG